MTERQGFFLQWHLTERCNLRCRHCYQAGASGDELSPLELLAVVDEVADTLAAWSNAYEIPFSPSFNVTGGEPLLRHDLFDLLEHLRSRGFPAYLLTNGTLIDREIAERLRDSGIEGAQVSVEGPEEVHDSIRGKGSFGRALRGVEALLSSGLHVNLNVTLSTLNAAFVRDLIELATSSGVPRISFSRLVPYGRGAELLETMLAPSEIRDIYRALASVKIPGLAVGTGDPIAAQLDLDSCTTSGCTAVGGCAAGVSGLTLLPDGTLNPCRRLPIPIGNLRTDSLREVWAASPVLALLRDRSAYKGRCGSCSRWAGCRGCRAIAYARSLADGEGDFLAEDPQCFLA